MKYGLLIVAVIALGVAGYSTYLLYPRFDLPAVDAVGLAVLALAAGVAAFFSPCSFPLLATLLIRESEGERNEASDRRIILGRALSYAAALSLGTTVFLLLMGGIIAAGGQAILENVTFTSPAGRVIRIAAGVALIILGLVQLERLRFPFHRVATAARPLLQSQAQVRRRAPVFGFAIFGFGYLVAGFG
jgi:cytochrome c biogenesis protein CcdA